MRCGCVRIRMSSSSTTTSDTRNSPKPLDSRVDPGVFALLGEARSGRIPQGFRRKSAPDAASCRSGSQLNHVQAVAQSPPGPISLTASRTTQSSASVTSCASRYRSLSLHISLRAAPMFAASPRAPRACRVTRAASPETPFTSLLLPQSGVVTRVRGRDHPGIRRSRSPC
jgi:hypothetical protein